AGEELIPNLPPRDDRREHGGVGRVAVGRGCNPGQPAATRNTPRVNVRAGLAACQAARARWRRGADSSARSEQTRLAYERDGQAISATQPPSGRKENVNEEAARHDRARRTRRRRGRVRG